MVLLKLPGAQSPGPFYEVMMETWVLLLYFQMAGKSFAVAESRGEAVTTIEFHSQLGCEEARTKIKNDLSNAGWAVNWTYMTCLKK